jgi:hypothetical protein
LTNFNQIWHTSPWREGIQFCSNEGERLSPRGDNSKEVNIHLKFLKILFLRTSKPSSIKLSTNCLFVKGIQVCSNKGPGPRQWENNHKNVKIGWGHLNIFPKISEQEELIFF